MGNFKNIGKVLLRVAIPVLLIVGMLFHHGKNITHLLGVNFETLFYCTVILIFLTMSVLLQFKILAIENRAWMIMHEILDYVLSLTNILIRLYLCITNPVVSQLPQDQKIAHVAGVIFINLIIEIVIKLFFKADFNKNKPNDGNPS